MDHLCYYVLCLSCFRVCSLLLWSLEGKGLTLALVCDVITFPFGILGQVWYLIVLIPDPCCLSDFLLLHVCEQHRLWWDSWYMR